ncbi:hypothetical protein D3C86_1858410 [compost metagenome]
MKAFQYEKVKAGMPWAKDYSKGMVNYIGFSELLGGIGLIVPYATGISPILTPIAAYALGFIMILAVILHTKRKENSAIGMNILFLAILLFVALGRW